MAKAPVLQLTDISLTFGGAPLLDRLSLTVQAGDRIALVGRNGSGKSTLMKIIAGLVEPDAGTRSVAPGIRVGYMEQDPDLSKFKTLGEFAASALDKDQTYRVDVVAEGLKLDPSLPPNTASGGERRRAAMAKLLAEAPDLMLLDEPTNHLDIEAIHWLENQLKDLRSTFLVISHDRALLRAVASTTLWIDRGVLRRQNKGFESFEVWRDAVWEEEDQARHKLDRKIKAEARWAVEGISARRKRNQGRLRALQALKADRAAQIRRQGAAALMLEAGAKSGRKVIDAKGISKRYEDVLIVKDFDLKIHRKDRIAIVGPNGVGKTSLLRVLMKEEEPDSGVVTHGTNLIPAIFDQTRSALDPDTSLWDSLTDDREMRVSGRADQILVRGQPKHVVGYLKEFLFDEGQARAPVRSLSGGEKARLLLAKLMARSSNFLILDEPTNDLDIETLDLLQELLDNYDGTVLLVSHDRDFLDRVATKTVVMEGGGVITVYAGGWSDHLLQKGSTRSEVITDNAPKVPKDQKKPKAKSSRPGLSFTEKHRFETLPVEIERLENEIEKLEAILSDATLFLRDPEKFKQVTDALSSRQAVLSASEEEWLRLAEKAEG